MQIIYRTVSYSEALVLQSKLQAYDIPCQFEAMNFTTFQVAMNFMSGCNLSVPKSMMAEARAIIEDQTDKYFDDEEDAMFTCPKCGGQELQRVGSFALFLLGLLVDPFGTLVPEGKVVKCGGCKSWGILPWIKDHKIRERLIGFSAVSLFVALPVTISLLLVFYNWM